MKKIQSVVLVLVLASLFAAPVSALAAPAQPAPMFEDVVIFGDSYTVASGQTVQGSLVIFGGSATVEPGASVTGEVIVFGGSADLSGQVDGSTVVFGGGVHQTAAAVNGGEVVVFGGGVDVAGHVAGDLVVFGGDVNLASTAVVDGDLTTPGGEVQRAVGAVVSGNIVDNFQFDMPRSQTPPLPVVRDRFFDNDFGGYSVIWLLFRSFAMATVALLVVLFAPNQLRRIADAVLADPIASTGFGILGFVVAAIATIGLAVTLILIPVAILVPFVVVTAVAFGWIGLGVEVGRRMGDAFKANWSPALQATFGTFVLTFAAGVIGWVPCIGFLASKVLMVAGFGAVILTRFGGQVHIPAKPSAPAPETKALPAPRKRSTRTTKK